MKNKTSNASPWKDLGQPVVARLRKTLGWYDEGRVMRKRKMYVRIMEALREVAREHDLMEYGPTGDVRVFLADPGTGPSSKNIGLELWKETVRKELHVDKMKESSAFGGEAVRTGATETTDSGPTQTISVDCGPVMAAQEDNASKANETVPVSIQEVSSIPPLPAAIEDGVVRAYVFRDCPNPALMMAKLPDGKIVSVWRGRAGARFFQGQTVKIIENHPHWTLAKPERV